MLNIPLYLQPLKWLMVDFILRGAEQNTKRGRNDIAVANLV
jgi:hypothetical protein